MNNFNEKKVNIISVCGIRRFYGLPCKRCGYFDECARKDPEAENKTPEKRVLLGKNDE